VALHAGLLLVPFSQEYPDRRFPGPALLIELRRAAPAEQPFVRAEPITGSKPVPPGESPEPVPEPAPDPLPEVAAQEAPALPLESEPAPEPESPPSTAVLLQSAADRKWRAPAEDSTRRLGVFVPQDVPPNWKPSITLDENLFDGMTVPRQVRVVDRWISPDGAYNVVVNMPNGDTLCGRGQAWDPMQPLIEHVVQFASCGGGGKRTFQWPDRYRNQADNGVMANSTTN
jgi:hypothetical protein